MGAAQAKSSASVAPMAADGQDLVPYRVSQVQLRPGDAAMQFALPSSEVRHLSWYVSETPPSSPPPPPSLAPPGPSRTYDRRLLDVKVGGASNGGQQFVATSADTGPLIAAVPLGWGKHSLGIMMPIRLPIDIDGKSFEWREFGLDRCFLCFRKDGDRKERLVAAVEDMAPSDGVLLVAATFGPPELFGDSNARRRFAQLATSAIAVRQLSILASRWRIEEWIRG